MTQVTLVQGANPMIAGTHTNGANPTVAPAVLGWQNITVQQGGLTYNVSTKRFTVPIAGFYKATCSVSKPASQGCRLNIGVNTDAPTNVTAKATSYADTASGTTHQMVTQILSLAANDYVTFSIDIGQIYSNVGDNPYQYFSIIKVG